MRIDYCVFQDIEEFYGTNDFQIEARYDKFDNEEYIMLRFGYWAEVDLIGLEEIINPIDYNIEVMAVDEEDTGWRYSYHIKQK